MKHSFWFVGNCILSNVFDILAVLQYNVCVCAAPVPGCPGCGEGSVSVWEHRKNPCHCNGSQVFSQVISYIITVHQGPSCRFKWVGNMNIGHWHVCPHSIFRRPYFLTRFLPALLTPKVVSTFTLLLFFVCSLFYLLRGLHITCMNPCLPFFQFQLPVKADARMTFIEALKKWVIFRIL